MNKFATLVVLASLSALSQAAPKATVIIAPNEYYIETVLVMSWYDAKAFCIDIGGNYSMTSMQTQAEDSALRSYLNSLPDYINEKFWTCGNDIATEGEYYWDCANQKITWFNWASGEPNDSGLIGSEDCIELDGNRSFFWNDNDCSKKQRVICERPWI